MSKINGVALTEKGAVKSQVRKTIVEKEIRAFERNALIGYDRVNEKAVLTKAFTDLNGNVIYATFTLVVSTTNPSIEKPKTQKAKKEKVEETFAIEED